MIKQPSRKGAKKKVRKPVVKKKGGTRKKSQDYGVSKLESDFAHNFLDKMKLNYVYEYEAKEIGRFYDFAIVAIPTNVELIMEEKNGVSAISQNRNDVRVLFLLEIDGDYFHSNPKYFGKKDLSPMQKHNKFVDKLKDEWCEKHKIPLLRIWEDDIRNNPKAVFKMIDEVIEKLDKLDRIKANINKPHRKR